MSQPVEGSALRNVFGSHISLAELNGDVSRVQSREPTRPPTPEHHEVTTKRARSRTITQRGPPLPKSSPTKLAKGLAALFVAGVVLSIGIAHFVALGRFGEKIATLEPKIHPLILVGSGIASVLVGLLFVVVDKNLKSTSKQAKDWASFVRGSGAVLGLCYATSKLASTWVFWGLANPILWYVIDATPQGFASSAAISVLGAATTGIYSSITSWHDYLLISASYFSAAVLWGNLGRRLFA